jgi:hypothetical protein
VDFSGPADPQTETTSVKENPAVPQAFQYGGDEPGGPLFIWFQKQLKAIAILMDSELFEAALTVIYSGIDTFGFLAAPPEARKATGKTFTRWCEQYILPRLQSDDGTAITSADLYAARCGILHTSTPVSLLERDGEARQIFYVFRDRVSEPFRYYQYGKRTVHLDGCVEVEAAY